MLTCVVVLTWLPGCSLVYVGAFVCLRWPSLLATFIFTSLYCIVFLSMFWFLAFIFASVVLSSLFSLCLSPKLPFSHLSPFISVSLLLSFDSLALWSLSSSTFALSVSLAHSLLLSFRISQSLSRSASVYIASLFISFSLFHPFCFLCDVSTRLASCLFFSLFSSSSSCLYLIVRLCTVSFFYSMCSRMEVCPA